MAFFSWRVYVVPVPVIHVLNLANIVSVSDHDHELHHTSSMKALTPASRLVHSEAEASTALASVGLFVHISPVVSCRNVGDALNVAPLTDQVGR